MEKPAIHQQLSKRILLLDGAMGSMVQQYRLEEKDYRGQRFADFPHDLKGNIDLLSLTRPDVIRSIHIAYLQAGAEIIETKTFSATSVSQAEYHMEDVVYELNLESAKLAVAAASEITALNPAKP